MTYQTIPQKNGTILVPLTDYEEGEEGFLRLQKALTEILQPDDAGYSVDSLCIGGYFKKGGILVKTSSTCPFDCCCLVYSPDTLSKAQMQEVESWLSRL